MKKLVFIFALIAAKTGFSQTAATNTGVLYISNSVIVFHAEGDLTNNSGAALTNNGPLYVRGNLTNNESSMAIGGGTLYLNGSSAQAVNGSQPFRTFNFVSNNAAGITLNNNLSVTGAHTFTSGIITTSATPNYLIYQAGASYSGDADSRHVNGWVKKFGSTNFVFPVGNGTVERTAALSSLSASSEFNATYRGANTPNYTLRQSPVTMIDKFEYWPITKVSGGSAVVTLNWNYPKVYFPNWIVPDILVGGWNGSIWTDNGGAGTASGTTTTTGTVSSSSVSSFNLFAIGSLSWVLSASLLDFNAVRKDNHTVVEWSTDKEVNTKHFIVERSDDGSSFYAIDKAAARNSGAIEKYSTNDNAPIQRIAYYRLRIVDNDGQEKFSRIVAVADGKASNELVLLSNPVHSKITLLASSSLKGEFRYQLNTINGQLVQQGNISIKNGGQYEIAVDGKTKPGMYSLTVVNQQQSFIYKLLVL